MDRELPSAAADSEPEEPAETLEEILDYLNNTALYGHIRDRPLPYLWPFIHPAYAVVEDDLDEIFEPYHSGLITEEAMDLLINCDIFLRGPHRRTAAIITVPVITSNKITSNAIIRVSQTAELLRNLGFNAEPLVFGNRVDNQMLVFAASQSVMVRTRKDWR